VVSVADFFTGEGYGASASLAAQDAAVSVVLIPEPAAAGALCVLFAVFVRPRRGLAPTAPS
jgi:hypothetical protein